MLRAFPFNENSMKPPRGVSKQNRQLLFGYKVMNGVNPAVVYPIRWSMDQYREPTITSDDLILLKKENPFTRFLFCDFNFVSRIFSRRSQELIRAIWITFILGSLLIFFCSLVLSGFDFATTARLIRDTFTAVNGSTRNLTQGFLTLTMAPIAVYWSLDAIFGRRWTYCAGLYNELVKMRITNTPTDRLELYFFNRKEEYLEALIAYDLFDLDLYHQKSFSEFFARVLEKSVKEKNWVLNSFIVDLRSKKIGHDEVKNLLSAYLDQKKRAMESARNRAVTLRHTQTVARAKQHSQNKIKLRGHLAKYKGKKASITVASGQFPGNPKRKTP
ncbi:hypothetical protein [Bdellovibrio bacteriovorus]